MASAAVAADVVASGAGSVEAVAAAALPDRYVVAGDVVAAAAVGACAFALVEAFGAAATVFVIAVVVQQVTGISRE